MSTMPSFVGRGTDRVAMTIAESTPGADASGVDLAAIVADDRAFRVWYDRTAPRVFAYLLSRCGSEPLAEDLLQATFIEVVRRPAAYDGRPDAVPWLIGIARHQLARHYRKRAEAARGWFGTGGVREIEPAGEGTVFDAANLGADIRVALRSLPPLQQAALVFRFLDGLTVREVAAHLAKSEAATASLLRRARSDFERVYRGDPPC
jgi:RNA polymerase sigma-70 factor (ECF subfamily)